MATEDESDETRDDEEQRIADNAVQTLYNGAVHRQLVRGGFKRTSVRLRVARMHIVGERVTGRRMEGIQGKGS